MTDDLVLEAQEGNQESLLLLLHNYGYREQEEWTAFLGKYLDLFLYGKVNVKDKDTRRFIQLYIKDKAIRNKLVYHHQDYVGQKAAQEVADYLQEQVASISLEDLEQSLVELFLECLQRYEKQSNKIDFSGYVYNVYRYKVYHYLRKNVFKFDVLQYDERETFTDALDPTSVIDVQESWFDRFYAADLKRDDLGLFWINGRCAEVFSNLTVFERMILRDRYFYNITDGDIAHRYGYHINTIYKRRHRAIEKLAQNKKESDSD